MKGETHLPTFSSPLRGCFNRSISQALQLKKHKNVIWKTEEALPSADEKPQGRCFQHLFNGWMKRLCEQQLNHSILGSDSGLAFCAGPALFLGH